MTLYILPGMGATSDMYTGPWRTLKNTVLLDWPDYQGESTLAQIAQRIVEMAKITDGDILAGSSLGGMVALEIGVIVNSPLIVLIGSACTASEVSTFLRLAAPLAAITPIGLSQVLGGIGKMFRQADPKFVTAMSLAIAKWDGVSVPDRNVARIHGAKDLIIPCPKTAFVVPGAGHLVAYTHPKECVTEVEKLLNRDSILKVHPQSSLH